MYAKKLYDKILPEPWIWMVFWTYEKHFLGQTSQPKNENSYRMIYENSYFSFIKIKLYYKCTTLPEVFFSRRMIFESSSIMRRHCIFCLFGAYQAYIFVLPCKSEFKNNVTFSPLKITCSDNHVWDLTSINRSNYVYCGRSFSITYAYFQK